MVAGDWKFKKTGKIPVLKNAVLISGMPGIGNVGKIVVDFLIEELKAERIYDISSYSMPQSVFVNENNLVELPRIEMYYKKLKKQNFIFLTGDIQPISEESCYAFCEQVLDETKKFGVNEIITLGGIGLHEVPKKPKVYCTGNSASAVKKFNKGLDVDTNLYGIVGPILGVSGLLVGLSKNRGLPGITLLSETLGHPLFLGIKGAKQTVMVLNKKYDLKLKIAKLDKEIKNLDKEMRKTDVLSKSSKDDKASDGVRYIG